MSKSKKYHLFYCITYLGFMSILQLGSFSTQFSRFFLRYDDTYLVLRIIFKIFQPIRRNFLAWDPPSLFSHPGGENGF